MNDLFSGRQIFDSGEIALSFEMPAELDALLKSVARSFYLTLRVLPRGLRKPIGLAYLLARAADTVADSKAVSPSQRRDALLAFSHAIDEPHASLGRFTWLHSGDGAFATQSPAEHELLLTTEGLLDALAMLDAADADAVRRVLHTLVQGMTLDLATFPPEGAGTLAALERPQDLDHYTYLVAGCVGEFWTDMLALHTPAMRGSHSEALRRWGVEYGKALQLTNVLRDVPRDLRIGRCYLPRVQLAEAGLTPEDLLDPRNTPRARVLLLSWINAALKYYASAAHYVEAIPRHSVRLRLAALWPALIGLQTLALLAESPRWLDPQITLKVGRGWIYRMLLVSAPASLSNFAIRAWLGALERRVRRAMAAAEGATR